MATQTPTQNTPTASGDSLGSGQIANAPVNEPGPGTSSERETRQRRTGMRFLAIGVPLIVIGLVLVLALGNGNQNGIGAAVAFIGALPTIVGLVLLGSAWTSSRSRRDKPFA